MRHIDQKAIKLVLERRVTVRWQSDDGLAASGKVDGDTDTYTASFNPEDKTCTCPAGANHRLCSHVRALELEVQRQVEGVAV